MPEDYYKTLGVSRDASADEIQKAYRKLARKYHPDLADDKEAAKEQFQKVQHAYEVLSDEKKRNLYDRLGPEFERAGGYHGQVPDDVDMEQMFGGSMPPGGFEDILRQIFGGATMGGGFTGADPRGGGFPGGGFPGGGFQPGGTRTQTRQAPARGHDIEQSITIPFATAVLGGKHQLSLKRTSG
ncbi:MAG: DnaJ domain-containing protein, partial [Pirellulaceae bacterium]